MSSKRTRSEYEQDDSDDDEPSLGRQILPVASALPSDGIPVDGMQYLFAVRRDARDLPHVTRVANPYELPEILPPRKDAVRAKHPSLPSTEWSKSFELHFNNLRRNVAQCSTSVQAMHEQLMPDKKERDLWWAFIAGENELCWKPPKLSKQINYMKKKLESYSQSMRGYDESTGDVQLPAIEPQTAAEEEDTPLQVPREPTSLLICRIDHRTALHLLMYFTHWIRLSLDQPDADAPAQCITDSHARWIFFLLARVDEHLPGDDVSLLRNLARACLAFLKRLVTSRLSSSEQESNGNGMTERSCWIIIAAIVGAWGQRDLWSDAEDMLQGITMVDCF